MKGHHQKKKWGEKAGTQLSNADNKNEDGKGGGKSGDLNHCDIGLSSHLERP